MAQVVPDHDHLLDMPRLNTQISLSGRNHDTHAATPGLAGPLQPILLDHGQPGLWCRAAGIVVRNSKWDLLVHSIVAIVQNTAEAHAQLSAWYIRFCYMLAPALALTRARIFFQNYLVSTNRQTQPFFLQRKTHNAVTTALLISAFRPSDCLSIVLIDPSFFFQHTKHRDRSSLSVFDSSSSFYAHALSSLSIV